MSAVKQIEAAHARNLAVKCSRIASMPEVGIFWLIDKKLVADSIPWRQANIKGKEYTDYPRGRVLFDAMEEVFRVYSSRAIISSPALRNLILAEFKLPLAATKFAADYHYENVVASLLDEDFDA